MMPWVESHRCDPRAVAIADRHYNRQKIGTPQFVPPGRCFVLLTAAADALWVSSWPFAQYVRHAWPGAWICTCFRREDGSYRASELIRAALAATRHKWGTPPPLGMVTFVNPGKIRRKRDPGRCFVRAGFRLVGTTGSGLLAFQCLPTEMPEASAAVGMHIRDLFA